VSGPFGEHDPLLGAGALPPLAGRRVGGGAQVGEGGGEAAAGGVHGFGYGMYVRQNASGLGAGVFDRRERVLDAVARAVVGDRDDRDEAEHRADERALEGQQVFYL
jgi:hypothetical protein